MVRTYVSGETHKKVKKFATGVDMRLKDAYDYLIGLVLDYDGHMRELIVVKDLVDEKTNDMGRQKRST